MSKKKQSRKRKTPKKKVSAMVLDFAREYIAMGEDLEDKQELLNGASSAWNIACLDEIERDFAIKRYMKQFSKLNPTHNKKDLDDVEENLRLLIKQKEKLYPNVKIHIAGAYIEVKGGKDHVYVMSLREEQLS